MRKLAENASRASRFVVCDSLPRNDQPARLERDRAATTAGPRLRLQGRARSGMQAATYWSCWMLCH